MLACRLPRFGNSAAPITLAFDVADHWQIAMTVANCEDCEIPDPFVFSGEESIHEILQAVSFRRMDSKCAQCFGVAPRSKSAEASQLLIARFCNLLTCDSDLRDIAGETAWPRRPGPDGGNCLRLKIQIARAVSSCAGFFRETV